MSTVQIVPAKSAKNAKPKEVKAQCIALKADRAQCNRTVDAGATVCWQHLKSGTQHGTIHEPAPIKPKSNRGRPKKNKEPVESASIPINSENLSMVIPSFVDNVVPSPPNSFLSVDSLKDINYIITDKTRVLDNTKEIGIGPFEIEINVGAEPHISITKNISFGEGKYTTQGVFQKIMEFFTTKPSDSDYDELIEKAKDSDLVEDHYNDTYENDEDATYVDLQLNMLKINSIVCRDSKYVCVLDYHDEEN